MAKGIEMGVFRDRLEEREFLEAQVNALTPPLDILEAGCGRNPLIRVNVPHKLTGLDSDADSLEIRRQKHCDLHETIVGDLRTEDFSPASFDVIYCSFVLEHIENAELVLENFARWLKPGGLLILRVPDRDSAWGFVTRHTPFAFHVFVRRHLMGDSWAGRIGHGPYPVYYDRVISARGMAQFCDKNGLTIQFSFQSGYELRKSRIIKLASSLGGLLSLGRLASKHNNLTFIIRKP